MESDRPRLATVRSRLPLLLGLAALLLLAVLATRGGSAVPRGNGLVIKAPTHPEQGQGAVIGAQSGHQSTAITASLTGIIAIVLLIYFVGMIIFMVMLTQIRLHRVRGAGQRGGYDDAGDEGKYAASAVVLLRGARAALLSLRQRAGGPPSDAVVRAWLVLEQAAAESGTARRPQQTSTEFTSAMLADHDVDPGALTTLRTLYQRARFGRSDTVTERDADAAVTALDRIADTLTVLAATADTTAGPS